MEIPDDVSVTPILVSIILIYLSPYICNYFMHVHVAFL